MQIVLGVLVALFTVGAANFWLVDNDTAAALACLGISVVAAVGLVIARALGRIETMLRDVRNLLTPHRRTGGRSGRERRANKSEPSSPQMMAANARGDAEGDAEK
jgi:hypothetical protein